MASVIAKREDRSPYSPSGILRQALPLAIAGAASASKGAKPRIAQIAKRTPDLTTPTEQDNNKLLTIFVSPHQDLRHKFPRRVCCLKAER
ncbi:hypothetical protein H6F98_18170 [Microcoleus sp. FACHB-SPT15]|uniref:hypothetical protein n=1 Tax=Microcoleus sp. FACHB-SPT15 TaxID=2692830 RepID=UPI0017842A8B|nr:hypothetical protein [Microcoleus sp. FACHB-SPT15]MBD1807361.1 hypothetical protein [Microcoleus sp. FACHB-SPT15]